MNKSYVKDINTLPFWRRFLANRGKKYWMIEPFSGNVYAFVQYNEELYLVGENPLNRTWGSC